MSNESVQSDNTEIQSDNQNQDQQNNSLTLEQLLEENKKLQASLKVTSEEAKKYRQTNSTLKTQIEQTEAEKLKEQGKWQELHDKQAAKAKELEEKLKEKDAKVAFKNIESEFIRVAAESGCLDTRALIKLSDLKKVSIDDELNVDVSAVKKLVEEAKTSMAYLFKSKAPGVNDLPPTNGAPPGKLTVEAWSKLPYAEKQKRLAEVMEADAQKK